MYYREELGVWFENEHNYVEWVYFVRFAKIIMDFHEFKLIYTLNFHETKRERKK